jgi:signal transduction histidine kinase
MPPRIVKETPQPRREQTDESLRIEREKSDAAAARSQHKLDHKADAGVQVAREHEDEVVMLARNELERDRPSSRGTDELSSDEVLADDQLAIERARADALLKHERAKQRRFFELFLANEREATDAHLMDERADADRIVASRDDFLATVSHDLRSLLGGLSLSAQVLLENAPPGPPGDLTRKCANTSKRLVSRMSRLVNDLLDMTSLEAGRIALLMVDNDVADILRDTLEAFEPIAADQGVTLTGTIELAPSDGRFDAGRILQVLANLVSNAVKFTPRGGKVEIRVVRDETELSFAVRDTGVGIPEEAISGVFEKFKQVSKDRRGLGLGLHIARGLVEAHGGRMWLESEVGVGSTFHFAIPNAPRV